MSNPFFRPARLALKSRFNFLLASVLKRCFHYSRNFHRGSPWSESMPARAAQHITFEFSRLASSDPAVTRAIGRASIAFDGRGRWWVESIYIDGVNPARSGFVPQGSDAFEKFAVAFETSRSDEIANAINRNLRDGGYMRLFGEHMPNDADNRVPPRVRPLMPAFA